MATSGTATFTLDLTDVVEEAFERCGGELRSGYDLRTARRSLNLLFADWANRGLNLWTLEQGTVALLTSTASYVLPADTVDLIEYAVRTGSGATQADQSIQRIAVSEYAAIPNKLLEGRPNQIFVQRLTAAPTLYVWPVPSSDDYTLVYWRLRRIEDAGDGTETPDVPFRFVPPLVAGLAYYLALKVPGGFDRLQVLKQQYDEAWQMASDEDRDRSSVRFVPKVASI